MDTQILLNIARYADIDTAIAILKAGGNEAFRAANAFGLINHIESIWENSYDFKFTFNDKTRQNEILDTLNDMNNENNYDATIWHNDDDVFAVILWERDPFIHYMMYFALLVKQGLVTIQAGPHVYHPRPIAQNKINMFHLFNGINIRIIKEENKMLFLDFNNIIKILHDETI